MDSYKVVIVDDSSFSITYIKDILVKAGLQVVGTAKNLEEVKRVVEETKPDLVTMDMTLPGTDGLECTRAVHAIDKNIKVIIVSAMMDDEIVKKAKKTRVSGYVQKPVESEELLNAIQRVMDVDKLFMSLQQSYFDVYKEALSDAMNKMAKTKPEIKEEYSNDLEHISGGITVMVAIIGKFTGRLLIDFSQASAFGFAKMILKREPDDIDEILELLAEFTNIVAGNGCSILNKKNSAYGLRLAPPSILRGDHVRISALNFNTDTAIMHTEFGEVKLDVGFKRGEEKWM